MQRMSKVAAIVVALSLAGCSVLTIQGPRTGAPASELPTCDEHASLPMLNDATAGILSLLVAYSLLSAAIDKRCIGIDCRGEPVGYWPAGVFAAGAVLYFASAVVGRRRTNACANAHRRYEAWLASPEGEPTRRAIQEQQLRAFAQRRRAAEQQRLRSLRPTTCPGWARSWRRETDPARKTRLYDEMPEKCRALITKPPPEDAHVR